MSDGTTDPPGNQEASVAHLADRRWSRARRTANGMWPGVVVSGPMNAGKRELLAELLRDQPGVDRIVSVWPGQP